jgi:butyrate kinase
MKVLVINPGATSTKISVFDEQAEIFKTNIEHSSAALAPFARIIDQLGFRKAVIEAVLTENGFRAEGFSAVCGRGGLLRHIPSGTYAVNDRVLEDIKNPPYGEHASNLGAVLAKEIADTAGIPAFFVDPVSVDELQPLARVSGFKGMERESFFHALNQKAAARKAAQQLGRPYESLNLIVVHMGGGVSVAAHAKGRVIDNYNVKDDGSFSLNRGGALPTNALINYCFSGVTKAEAKRVFGSEAGVFSYLGTMDFRAVEDRAFAGDSDAMFIFDAMAYQHAKDIGGMAAVLCFEVDALVFTGGIANSRRFCAAMERYVGKLAPVIRIPGEEEMRALAEGALRVLHGEPASIY